MEQWQEIFQIKTETRRDLCAFVGQKPHTITRGDGESSY